MPVITKSDVQGMAWGHREADANHTLVAQFTYDAWGDIFSEYIAPSAVALARLRKLLLSMKEMTAYF